MKTLLKNCKIVNENKIYKSDILISGNFIERIDSDISESNAKVIDVKGKCVLPGVIDDQVHFREPGLTHKADIYTESRAAVAGGVTSFMEMPNVKPPTTNIENLEAKYEIGAQKSVANYSFYMGTTNDNYDEIMKIDLKNTCGLKIFMGSSTGNMLVDN
jgi:dihydroorotase